MQVSESRVAAALGRAAATGAPAGGSPPPSPTSANSGRNPFGAEARLDLSSRLKLDQIRVQLLRQEDNILFGWVKRSAYRRNAPVYQPGGMAQFLPDDAAAAPLSLLMWHLQQTEALHARIRRYTSPDEHAFFPALLPAPVLPPLTYAHSPLPSYADEINMNDAVLAAYCGPVLDAVAEAGDDHNYGSSVLNDVACLQALSKRIHFGKFVAEAKYRENSSAFDAAIAAGDGGAIMAALTYPEQEAAVAARVARKAAAMGASVAEVEPGAACLVTPEAAAQLWVDVVMPLTKQVQVAYLLRRGEAREAPGQPGRFAQGQARGTGPPGGFI